MIVILAEFWAEMFFWCLPTSYGEFFLGVLHFLTAINPFSKIDLALFK